jgi:protein TonB
MEVPMRLVALSFLLLLMACAGSRGPLTPEQQAERSAWANAVSERLRAAIYHPRDPRQPFVTPEGTVVVEFSMDAQGRPYTPQVQRSSGSPLLDAAALTTVLTAAPFPAPPAFLLNNDKLVTLGVPMNYRMALQGR